jgi:hypothetical protein
MPALDQARERADARGLEDDLVAENRARSDDFQ